MRFLTCEPNLSAIPDYIDEADVFYQDPVSWLQEQQIWQSTDSGDHLNPSHLVMFNTLQGTIEGFLKNHTYAPCGTFFHTHVPEGRVGSRVLVYCSKEWRDKRERWRQQKLRLRLPT